MDIIMFIIKALFVLVINIGLGYILSYCFHAFFFYPKKLYFLGKYPVSFTPGLLHRKKKQLIDYLNKKLNEYFDYVKKDYFDINFLTEFENKIFNDCYPHIHKFLNKDWLPGFLKTRLEYLISDLLWLIIYKLTRKIIPKLLKDYQAEKQILLLDIKLDIYKLKQLFEEHVFKYFLYFNLVFFTIIGIINMFLFVILA